MCLIFWRWDKPIYRNKRKSNVNKRSKINAGKLDKGNVLNSLNAYFLYENITKKKKRNCL